MRDLIQIRYRLLTCYNIDGLLTLLSECGQIADQDIFHHNTSAKESLEDLVSDIESRLQILNSNSSAKVLRVFNPSDKFHAQITLDSSSVNKNFLPMPVDVVRLQAIYKDDHHIPPSTKCYISYETFPTFIVVKFKFFEQFLLPHLKDRTTLNVKCELSGLSREDVLEISDKYDHFISDETNRDELSKIELIELDTFGLGELRKEYIRLVIDELGTDKEFISQASGLSIKRIDELLKSYCEYKEFDGADGAEGDDHE